MAQKKQLSNQARPLSETKEANKWSPRCNEDLQLAILEAQINILNQKNEDVGHNSPPIRQVWGEPTKDQVVKVNSYCGLSNLGSTCYASACLQMLYTAAPIRRYLVENQTKGPFHLSLAKLFEEMQTAIAQDDSLFFSSSPSVAPSAFLTQFRAAKPIFRANQMHDAQEFLCILIELVHQEANTAKKLRGSEAPEPKNADEAWNFHVAHVEESFLSRQLMGQVETILMCRTCGHQSKSWECFWQLSLQIQREKPAEEKAGIYNRESAGETVTLKDCITEFEAEELLTSDNARHCSRCNTIRPIAKRARISRLPSMLIVHLKRFAADGTKLYRQIVIDELLELAGIQFVLLSAVLHEGKETGGHNFTLHLDRDNNWIRLDDAQVTEGLPCGYTFELLRDSAYLCLYKSMGH